MVLIAMPGAKMLMPQRRRIDDSRTKSARTSERTKQEVNRSVFQQLRISGALPQTPEFNAFVRR